MKPFEEKSLAPLPADAAARCWVLIPCAGSGQRAGEGGPKQYRPIAGRPMVRHTVEAFRGAADRLAGVWVVIAPDDEDFLTVFPDFNGKGEYLLAGGGATRAATVLAGLRAMRASGVPPTDWVLVHDAARCLITPAQIGALIDACQGDAVGGLLAQPLADTLKAAEGGRVTATLPRGGKWLAQTPQMFRLGVLADALERAGDAVTDEASAIEALGLAPRLVAGSAQNFKVTWPEDFALAEAVLAARAHADMNT